MADHRGARRFSRCGTEEMIQHRRLSRPTRDMVRTREIDQRLVVQLHLLAL